MHKTLTMDMTKALYSVDEVIACNGGILPLSKSAVYKLIREKKIPSRRLGKRVFILGSFISELAGGSTSGVSK